MMKKKKFFKKEESERKKGNCDIVDDNDKDHSRKYEKKGKKILYNNLND